jgi:vacuolar-type H+-ATPase subunit F/Vma7
MKNLVFLTPADARHGFSLAGARQLVVTAAEAEATLRQVLADPDTRVAVIDERLLAGIAEERFQEMERRWFGVLIVLPAPAKAGEELTEDYALRLIRRAIGYHVRLQG